MSSDLEAAKQALDLLIAKSRVHFYKPIQIAEILYHFRHDTTKNIDLLKLETYRNPSKKWRDLICVQFLGRVSTSSARYQDNLFEENAIPPRLLKILGEANGTQGIVEAYIYQAFAKKHRQLENALLYCLNHKKEDFDVRYFVSQFWQQPGLKRSIDKILEIVVYALFETLIVAIGVKIDIYYDQHNHKIVDEFAEFAEKVLNLSSDNPKKSIDAHFYRVGVTNAADRGLDMFANFGSVVQVKHLSLDESLAEEIVTSITSHRIIIICKKSEERIIQSLLTQIGWRSRIQSIITLNEIFVWYAKALHGIYADLIGDQVIANLASEIQTEFPAVGSSEFQEFQQMRGYDNIQDLYWNYQ